jgi:hypothetical protein
VQTVELVRSHLGPKPWYEHLAAWQLAADLPPRTDHHEGGQPDRLG